MENLNSLPRISSQQKRREGKESRRQKEVVSEYNKPSEYDEDTVYMSSQNMWWPT